MKIADIFKRKTKKIASVDFAPDTLKLVCIEIIEKQFRLIDFALKEISVIEQKQEAIDFLRNFTAKNAIREKEAYLTIPDSDSVFIKFLTLPVLPKGEILEAIKWQLKDEPLTNEANPVSDWQIISEYADKQKIKRNEIIACFAKQAIIDKYLSIIAEANLIPVKISLPPLNYAPFVNHLQNGAIDKMSAVLDIGNKNTSLSIYKNNKLRFARNLPFYLQKLIQSDKNLNLNADAPSAQITAAWRPFLEELTKEIKRSFDYFALNSENDKITLLYITGDGANLKNIDSYLNTALNIKVLYLPLPQYINISCLGNINFTSAGNRLTSALGALFLGSASINLLPQKLKAQKIQLAQRRFLTAGSLFIGIIFLASTFFIRWQIYKHKKRLKEADFKLKAVMELKILNEKIETQENIFKNIRQNKMPIEAILKLISAAIPENITLNELSFEQKKHTLIVRGIISSAAENAEKILAGFIKDIQTSVFFNKSSLSYLKKSEVFQEFEIKCEPAF